MHPVRIILLALLLLASALAQSAELRIALVIGNSSYAAAPLANPANDAKMIGETLTGLGFEVIARRDGDQVTMKRAIQEFGARLEQAGPDAVGLFYYAGHGVQLNGRNRLNIVILDACRNNPFARSMRSAGCRQAKLH
jgi:uncharacterized caspase-like protein